LEKSKEWLLISIIKIEKWIKQVSDEIEIQGLNKEMKRMLTFLESPEMKKRKESIYD